MDYKIIVEKSSARPMYIMGQAAAYSLEALFPPVRYNYLLWQNQEKIPGDVLREPWNFVIVDNRFEKSVYPYGAAAEENVQRAGMLMQLGRATNRHRRLVQKQGLHEQGMVNALKVAEARMLLDPASDKNIDRYPFLSDFASVSGVTLEQAANLVLMRSIQEHQVLRYTENQRLIFQKRILTTPLGELTMLKAEIESYERRG